MSPSSRSFKKIVKGGLVGIISGLIPFLLINLALIVDNEGIFKEMSMLSDLFANQYYRPVLLKLLKVIAMISLFGGTLGALIGVVMSRLDARNKSLIKRLIYGILVGAMWGIVSGVTIFRDMTALIWTFLIGIPWALLIMMFV